MKKKYIVELENDMVLAHSFGPDTLAVPITAGREKIFVIDTGIRLVPYKEPPYEKDRQILTKGLNDIGVSFEKREDITDICLGDEVIATDSITEPFVVISLDNNCVYGFDKYGRWRGCSRTDSNFIRTGRFFPGVAWAMRIMRIDREENN